MFWKVTLTRLVQTEKEWSYLDKTDAKPTIERRGERQGMYTKHGQIAAGEVTL